MALDLANIELTFIKLARQAVGDLLSSLAPNRPSVIQSHQAGVIPDFPFIQLSVDGISHTDGYLLDEYIDEDGNTVYDTHYRVQLRYTVFGNNDAKDKSASNIAQELESYFRMGYVLAQITKETTGTLEATSGITPSPQRLSTEYVESAFFTLTMNVNDRHISSEDGYFDTIELGGKVKRGQDDPDYFPFDLVETSNDL